MKRKIHKLLDKRFLPKWMVLSFDLTVIGVVFFFSYWLRVDFGNPNFTYHIIVEKTLIGLPIFFIAYQIFKPHYGIIRHTTAFDARKIFYTHFLGSAGLFLSSIIARNVDGIVFFTIPFSVILIHFFISV